MLDFIPNKIGQEEVVNKNRIHQICNCDTEILESGDIYYLASRELRVEDNFAVQFGAELAAKHNRNFKIIVMLDEIFYSKAQEKVLKEGLNFFKKNSALKSIDFEIVDTLPANIAALIVDFNPLKIGKYEDFLCCYPVYEVDSHNIIPARFVSDKQEYSAATLRRKIYSHIADFLKNYKNKSQIANLNAKQNLENFLANKLAFYAESKNNYRENFTSNMSPYLHFGFVSSQRIALDVLANGASRDNKEAYLEELIVRKELSDNFCLYNQNYKSVLAFPNWARESLDAHRLDLRNYIYSYEEFEAAKTHDLIWNEIQEGLLKNGCIHGYLRMYWAKKILEWSKSPEDALEIAIDLNDKYALDGNDPNGYVGILWSIGGLHDRAFANRLVCGKIRQMVLKK